MISLLGSFGGPDHSLSLKTKSVEQDFQLTTSIHIIRVYGVLSVDRNEIKWRWFNLDTSFFHSSISIVSDQGVTART